MKDQISSLIDVKTHGFDYAGSNGLLEILNLFLLLLPLWLHKDYYIKLGSLDLSWSNYINVHIAGEISYYRHQYPVIPLYQRQQELSFSFLVAIRAMDPKHT